MKPIPKFFLDQIKTNFLPKKWTALQNLLLDPIKKNLDHHKNNKNKFKFFLIQMGPSPRQLLVWIFQKKIVTPKKKKKKSDPLKKIFFGAPPTQNFWLVTTVTTVTTVPAVA